MDAGVPIKRPVAGVAMGLVMEGNRYAILSDIAGAEDHYGDMDFKVTGTSEGITALQMDIKVAGINSMILQEALEQARKGRMHILEIMEQAINEPREDISPYAPRIITMMIHPDKIRDVIGPGGKMIRSITEETGAKIDISDDGTVLIATADGEAAQAAVDRIRALTAEAEIGETYLGTVARIVDFGAFVEIIPGRRRFAAYFRDLRPARPRCSRRAQGRPANYGQMYRQRRQQDQVFPQSGPGAGKSPGRRRINDLLFLNGRKGRNILPFRIFKD